MALEKRTEYEYMIKPAGYIEVRRDDQVWEDGVFLAHTYHHHVIHPGQDTSQEEERGKLIAAVVHTPEVVADFWEAERLRQLDV